MSEAITLYVGGDVATCTDTKLLILELQQCTTDWLTNVAKMAAIVRRLDELGVEVQIENSLLPYIRLIAHGQLSANCFMACSGDVQLLERAMRLPLPIQEQIADNEPFKVMELGGDHRMVRPLDMTVRERRQVFHGKRLRTESEQIGWLREQSDKDRAKAIPAVSDDSPVELDRKRRGIVVGGYFIPIAQLGAYVAELSR